MTFTSARSRLLSAACLCLFFSLTFSATTRATIQYEVHLDHPEKHLFQVTMTIPDVPGEVLVRMPAWNALYQKETWRIKGTGIIKISYSTYWDEAGPFASQLNAEHAFINPAMILFYVPERRSENVKLSIPNPPDDWRAESSSSGAFESMGGARSFFFEAPSYDALADGPIEVGKFEEFQLTGLRPAVWVVVHGDNWKKKQVEGDLKRICQYELKLMEGAPFERYTFILHVGKGAGGGGMEHANSTAMHRWIPWTIRGSNTVAPFGLPKA